MSLRSVALTAVAVGLALALTSNSPWSNVLSNAGHLHILHAQVGPSAVDASALKPAETSFLRALRVTANNTAAQRGLGFVYWAQQEDTMAATEWQNAGWAGPDFIVFARLANTLEERLRLYIIAERVDPLNENLWLEVGRICQQQPSIDAICERFLDHVAGNWLVDPYFHGKWTAWSFNRREKMNYAITRCPDATERLCAMVEIGENASQHGASIFQCLRLVSGGTYKYSAWIKVETQGRWLPLYHQGDIEGEPAGRWPGDQTGSQEWKLWERTFTADDFDDQRACFHPVRLVGLGRAWFYGAELTRVDP